MPFAAAISEHPITAHAVGEVAGHVLEQLGSEPDLAMLFLTPPHGGAREDAARAVRSILQPRTLLGCAAVAVAGNSREVEEQPAVTLWAGRLGPVAPVPVRLTARRTVDGFAIEGWPDILPFEPQLLLLLPDPFTFPVDDLFEMVEAHWPGLPVVGGMASAARAAGGNRLALDGAIVSDGCVGAFIGPGVRVTTVVSQGCRPIGDPLVVTRSAGTMVEELAGAPPLERLVEQAKRLPESDKHLINQGVHLGIVINEHKVDFGVGDFLIRNVFGADRETGAIQVADEVPVGRTVQFHVRDAASADVDLRALLRGHTADGALLFTCNGRGVRLFGSPDHDASVLADLLDDPPTAGFFAAGELGPVGGRNFLHGFTASVVLFRDLSHR